VIENFIGTKRKVDIFIRTKNIIKKGNTCFFLTKHEFDINFYIFDVKNLYLICVLLKNSNFFWKICLQNILHIFIKKRLNCTFGPLCFKKLRFWPPN